MVDEVAGMPQAALREVVLRLVCPESPPPITASSEISLREQQATDVLRSTAAKRLSRSPDALRFLDRFNAPPELLDEIAGIFLDVAEAPPAFGHLLSKHTLPTLVFEEVLYAYRVVSLGASRPMMERMMVQLVRGGWSRQAEELAYKLGRKLTREEVLDLVKTYTEGAVSGSSDDKRWPEFAERHLGPEGAQLARRWIAERNRRWANDLY